MTVHKNILIKGLPGAGGKSSSWNLFLSRRGMMTDTGCTPSSHSLRRRVTSQPMTSQLQRKAKALRDGHFVDGAQHLGHAEEKRYSTVQRAARVCRLLFRLDLLVILVSCTFQ